VPQEAPAQSVIDGLFVASDALEANDRREAGAALRPPVFAAGPEVTLSRLAALPPLPETGRAAQRAGNFLRQESERSSRDSSSGNYP